MGQLVRWHYRSFEVNSERVGALTQALNEGAKDGWELVEMFFADKTLGMNSVFAIMRKPLSHPEDPDDVAPGWKPDPLDEADVRYWDGSLWTGLVRGTRFEETMDESRRLGPNPAKSCRLDEHTKCTTGWCTCSCHA